MAVLEGMAVPRGRGLDGGDPSLWLSHPVLPSTSLFLGTSRVPFLCFGAGMGNLRHAARDMLLYSPQRNSRLLKQMV